VHSSTPNMEGAGSSETLVTVYQITRRHLSEKSNHCHNNLKSHWILVYVSTVIMVVFSFSHLNVRYLRSSSCEISLPSCTYESITLFIHPCIYVLYHIFYNSKDELKVKVGKYCPSAEDCGRISVSIVRF
jgi:hypothetical protein